MTLLSLARQLAVNGPPLNVSPTTVRHFINEVRLRGVLHWHKSGEKLKYFIVDQSVGPTDRRRRYWSLAVGKK